MMQRHDQISRGNPPVPLELKILALKTIKLTVLNRTKASRFEHWLVMYLLKFILDNFQPKKVTN